MCLPIPLILAATMVGSTAMSFISQRKAQKEQKALMEKQEAEREAEAKKQQDLALKEKADSDTATRNDRSRSYGAMSAITGTGPGASGAFFGRRSFFSPRA